MEDRFEEFRNFQTRRGRILDIFSSDADLYRYLALRQPDPKIFDNFKIIEKKISQENLKNFKNLDLNQKNIKFLETNPLNERLDTFIIESMLRNPAPQSYRDLPQVIRPRFDSHGLSARVVQRSPLYRITIRRKEIDFEGDKYTHIDFMPGGRTNFDPSQITDSLANGIAGLTEFIQAINDRKFEAAPILMGTTNLNMALIAQRLGFTIADHCRTRDGMEKLILV